MGSFDLHCRACGRDFEVFVQGFLKETHKVCPDCCSREVEQRLTGGFVHQSSKPVGGGSHTCGPSFG